ncbi:MAG TPA: RagB/SusD family nutrient uptake outer membrane protein, partial [Niastella sp.]
NYYINPTSNVWQLLNTKEQNAYIWARDIYKGVGNVADWNGPYQQVLYANVVLDALMDLKATPGNQQQWNNLEGAAYFIRAYAFYNLSQVFALPYDATTKDSLGIPLKLTPNVDEIIKRATIEETYSQIISDLKQAKDLLQDDVPLSNRNRPSKPAALAMLARVYVSMRQYDNAMAYADSSLRMYAALMDFNTKDTNSQRPFDRFNAETLYQSKFVETNVLKAGSATRDYCIVDSLLYKSYAPNDLRRLIFYTTIAGNVNLKGSYNGTTFAFTGLATDELFLIRAEGRARSGDITGALNDLNTLLVQRFKTGTFVPYTATTAGQALALVLAERRKELAFRGLRWTDLRRFNIEGIGYTLQRKINNRVYELYVNSPLYVLPIPQDVIDFNHIQQNTR